MKSSVANISSVINHLSEMEAKWFAVYTKYKCEKYVAERLTKKGIAVYLPLLEVTKRYTSKVKRYQVPLINSYVFVKIKKGDYVRVLETEYVMRFLKQRKNLISIPESEIEVLQKVVGEIDELEVGRFDFSIGDEVEIISGNLTGLKGRLLDALGGKRFIVELETIGMQLAMTIDRNNLRLTKRRAQV